MNLVFASPTYGYADPTIQKDIRRAIMFASRHGYVWYGDASRDSELLDITRCNSVRTVLASPDANEVDGIVWIDSDMKVERDTIVGLMGPVKTHDLDFVTGMYYQRRPPHYPVVGNFQKGENGKWSVGVWDPRQLPTNQLVPVDACGFGIVYTSMRMLKAMRDPWFELEKNGFGTEDYDFCWKAKQDGFQLWLHTGVVLGHKMDPVFAGPEHMQLPEGVK